MTRNEVVNKARLNIDNKKHIEINKIGIELEGEFINNPRSSTHTVFGEYWKVDEDGSIDDNHDGYCHELKFNHGYNKEQTIEAIESLKYLTNDYVEGTDNAELFDKRFSYPNPTAGTHIHISLANKEDYDYLQMYRFYEEFLHAYIERFNLPKYKRRLNNKYCAQYSDIINFLSNTKEQRRATEHANCRYFAINYCERLHSTIEFRIFPYITSINGLRHTMEFIIDFIENYKIDKKDKIAKAIRSECDSMIIRHGNGLYPLWHVFLHHLRDNVTIGQSPMSNITVPMNNLSLDVIKMAINMNGIEYVKETTEEIIPEHLVNDDAEICAENNEMSQEAGSTVEYTVYCGTFLNGATSAQTSRISDDSPSFSTATISEAITPYPYGPIVRASAIIGGSEIIGDGGLPEIIYYYTYSNGYTEVVNGNENLLRRHTDFGVPLIGHVLRNSREIRDYVDNVISITFIDQEFFSFRHSDGMGEEIFANMERLSDGQVIAILKFAAADNIRNYGSNPILNNYIDEVKIIAVRRDLDISEYTDQAAPESVEVNFE